MTLALVLALSVRTGSGVGHDLDTSFSLERGQSSLGNLQFKTLNYKNPDIISVPISFLINLNLLS